MDEPHKQYAKRKKPDTKEPICKNYPEKYKLMNTEKNKIINCQGLGWECREGNGTPLQYSCLENPVDGGAW